MTDKAFTRQELVQLMDQVMNQTYSSLADEGEPELDTSLVKTYLIEADLSEQASLPEVHSMLEKLAKTPLSGKQRLGIDESRDSSLFLLTTKKDRELITAYLDVSNPRFWLLHSANRSTHLDWMIDRIVKENTYIDHGWLWPELLKTLTAKGSFRGLGLDYDRRKLPDIDFESPESVEYLKVQLWGMPANKILSVLQKEFPQATTLAKVKIKYWLSGQGDEFAVDDIKFDGKVTTRGTSFQSHLSLIAILYEEYADAIRTLESTYALQFNTDGVRTTISGEALSFHFPQPIGDLDAFCANMFSASLPFRLWGVPIKLNDEFARVAAVDLHSGSRLDLELTKDFIRVFLPPDSCGNTIVRLYTNLKHHYDSRIRVVNADEEPIL